MMQIIGRHSLGVTLIMFNEVINISFKIQDKFLCSM